MSHPPHRPEDLAYALALAAAWNGIGTTLAVNQSAGMPQTANGTMVFGWFNMATANNDGQLSLTSGGSEPLMLDAPALSGWPSALMQNWQANNLNVTNVSVNAATPIWICAYGPGVPGQTPLALKNDGTYLPLFTGQSAQGASKPQNMQLILSSTSPGLAVFAIIGGPADAGGNNGYLISVNAAFNSNPPPPDGYYATTMDNTYRFSFNWKGASLYVANMSPAATKTAGVRLIAI
jgi:hypothetical protein